VLWIDGVARDSAQMDGMSNGTPDVLEIGGNIPSGDPFVGLMDNLRVWNRARSAQQIRRAHASSP
jgi:hypothetical protein